MKGIQVLILVAYLTLSPVAAFAQAFVTSEEKFEKYLRSKGFWNPSKEQANMQAFRKMKEEMSRLEKEERKFGKGKERYAKARRCEVNSFGWNL